MSNYKTQQHLAVTLTASQWNTLLCLLMDAHSYNAERYLRSEAVEAIELKNVIREQVGSRISAAFEHDYPSESSALPFTDCVQITKAVQS